MTKKRLVLVGAPGSGKSIVQEEVKKLAPHLKILCTGNPNPTSPSSPAAGPLADYRSDLSLACRRMQDAQDLSLITKTFTFDNILFTHSLIDSLAYPTVRFYHMVNSGSVSEEEMMRWNMVLHINGMIFKDTFRDDWPVIHLAGNDGTAFGNDMEIVIGQILKDWDIPHTYLTDPNEAAKLAAKFFLEENDSGE